MNRYTKKDWQTLEDFEKSIDDLFSGSESKHRKKCISYILVLIFGVFSWFIVWSFIK
jgi:hypothetical protein